MPMFFFQLGHARDLSHAEIIAVNQRRGSPCHIIDRVGELLLVDAPSADPLISLCEELGGTVRLGECLSQSAQSTGTPQEHILELIHESNVIQQLQSKSDRPSFGVSLIGGYEPWGGGGQVQQTVQNISNHLKDELKSAGSSSRFVLPGGKQKGTLNAAQVEKNNLIEKGEEFIIQLEGTHLLLGRTLWIQGFEEFSERDYGRPQRDAFSGMLPPKLARMLIQLARTNETRTLLDPFCGSGSMLMEAALMGLDATGSDNSKKAVSDAKINAKWITQHHELLTGSMRILQADARNLHKTYDPLFFDACVTEPYLGPPLKKPLTTEQFRKQGNELSELYLRALGEIRTVVKPGARVVFIVPRFQIQDQDKPGVLNLIPTIKLQGYTMLDPLQNFTPVNVRSNLVYARPRQMVQREILVLQA